MSCLQTLTDYGLRSIGQGVRGLPKSDITLCDQFVLIGSGMIWNVYFAIRHSLHHLCINNFNSRILHRLTIIGNLELGITTE